jgi:hypothetical protein
MVCCSAHTHCAQAACIACVTVSTALSNGCNCLQPWAPFTAYAANAAASGMKQHPFLQAACKLKSGCLQCLQ